MTIKFPRTYKDLKEAEYIYDVEVCDSGVFIYIEENTYKNMMIKTAWGETSLKDALQMLKIDFWDSIKILSGGKQMKLKLDLPRERWDFIKTKLEPHKKDSETVTLFCHAIDSFDLEESLPQKIFQVLSASGKNPFQFPKARMLQDCNGGAGILKEIAMQDISLPTLADSYYQFLLDNFKMVKK